MTDPGHRWLLGGGIGCGKSTVRRLLESHGVVTLDADSMGRDIIEPDGPAFESVAGRWPESLKEGQIDRSVLADIVFSDPVQLAALESLTHPHIFGRIEAILEGRDDVVLVEIPLLHSTPEGSWRRMVVDCDDSIRLERLQVRGLSEIQARARMASQPSREEWLAVADIVVPNHGDFDDLAGSVEKVAALILEAE